MNEQTQHEWADLRLEWLWVYDGLVPKTGQWSKVIVVPQSVFFVLEGRGEIQADGAKIAVPQGHAFMAAAGTRKQWFAEGTRLLSVGFRATWPDGQPLVKTALNRSLGPAEQRRLLAATRGLFRAIHGRKRMVGFNEATVITKPSFTTWCAREAAFRQWFVEYARTLAELKALPSPRAQMRDVRLQEVVRRLDAWPLLETFAWPELVRGMPVGTRRLEQIIVGELGVTPYAYLNRRRIETARRLLVETALPLKQIAHDIGLRHASHFTKWFRRHTRLSPSEYRDRAVEVA